MNFNILDFHFWEPLVYHPDGWTMVDWSGTSRTQFTRRPGCNVDGKEFKPQFTSTRSWIWTTMWLIQGVLQVNDYGVSNKGSGKKEVAESTSKRPTQSAFSQSTYSLAWWMLDQICFPASCLQFLSDVLTSSLLLFRPMQKDQTTSIKVLHRKCYKKFVLIEYVQ